MLSTITRCRELLISRGAPNVLEEGVLWYVNNGIILPWGPAKGNYSPSPGASKRIFRELHAPMMLLTDAFVEEETPWYAVICSKFIPLEEMKSKDRNKLRRGFKKCQVELVDAEYVAKNGYETMSEACKSYEGYEGHLPPEQEWRKKIQDNAPFGDILHYWAVLNEGKMIAFSENYVYDKIEASLSATKIHPKYLLLYPGYALIYKMNEYYLNQGFECVNDGWRSIRHQTQIQEFLIDKFGFKKAFAHLRLEYKPSLRIPAWLAYPFMGLLGKFNGRLETLHRLQRISRGLEPSSHVLEENAQGDDGDPS